jgi:hypothetical protein
MGSWSALFSSAMLASALVLATGSVARAEAGVIDMGGSMTDQEAKAHFKVGKSLYEAGRFAEAAVEWEQAFTLSKKTELLYNVYVAYRDASDLPKAIDALQRYLDSAQVDPDTRINLQARLRAMQDASSRAPGPPPVAAPAPQVAASTPASAEPAPVVASPAPAQPAPRTTEPNADHSVAPYVLLGAGGTLLAVGVVTGIVASNKIAKIEDHCMNNICDAGYDLDGRRHDARGWRTATIVLAGVGVATAGVGAVLLLLRGGTSEREPRASALSPALGCGPGGCFGSIRGRF